MSRYGLSRPRPLPAQVAPTQVPSIPSPVAPSADHAAQARLEEARSRRSLVRWSCVAALAFVLNFRAELYQFAMGVLHFVGSLAEASAQLILLGVFVVVFVRILLFWLLVYLRVLLMTIATFVFIVMALISGNTKPPGQAQSVAATAPPITRAAPSETDWTERSAWSHNGGGRPR
ncbi:hypothetical protein [Methylobacterium radiotolerans]|uniref:hypothetical protein n=1 Tax=Methylobacterium radiotolerans TaxID=31998 RepID=UPI0038D03354